MNLSALFIRRPIMTTLVMVSILLFGAIGYKLLPVSDLPNIDQPYIMVTAVLPGANPDTMAATVATTLEKEFSTIAGIDAMSSASAQGQTQITIQFVLSRNIDAAAQDVQAAIARAQKKLPMDMTTPPSYRKVNPADQPILFLTMKSAALPMFVLDAYAENMLAEQISMVDGVAQVMVYGSQKYAVRIDVDPHALASRQIGIDEVGTVVSSYNVNSPLGILNGPYKAATIQSNGPVMEAKDYLPLIVAYRNGQPVRLREVAAVRDSVENDKVAAWAVSPGSEERAIVLAIQRQPGTNTVAIADAIKALLPKFRAKLPAAADLTVLRDSSLPIKESARDVQLTLLGTLVLVVLVIFLFLRNLSATVIPSLTLPMAVVGTFAVMYLLNYSLDNLSLMALTLSVGFVVDDAIVMLENIVRHMEMGKTRLEATFDGAKEIGFTIVSMTLSLSAVFIPVLFMPGLIGRLFREFSVTIGAAVLVSGLVSLTLTPMLCSRFLRDPKTVRHGAAYRATEAAFEAMRRFYGWTLSFVLRHKPATMIFSAGVLTATIWMFLTMPQGFLPEEDRDQIAIRTEAAQDISFDDMISHQLTLSDILRQDPNVDHFMCSVSGAYNKGYFFIVLKPRRERELTAMQVKEELRPKLTRTPGIRCMLTIPPTVTIGGRQTSSQYQLTVSGTDLKELYDFGDKLEDYSRQLDLIQDVSSDLQLKNWQYHMDVDHDQAFVMNVTPAQVYDAIYYAYGTRQVSTIYKPDDQYQVIMEVAPQYQTDPALLSMLHIKSSKGDLVPLRAVTKVYEDVGPMSVNHSGQLPAVTISFNLKPGVSLSQAQQALDEWVAANKPATLTAGYQGTAQAFKDSFSSLWILLLLAVLVIYIVLGILYESFYHPITILSALPFAAFGALATLMVFHTELSVYAFVGIIMLIGLVKKNGIMMVDFAIAAQSDGKKTPTEAIHEACLIRFRPIMMTTMSALVAGLPIALGLGAGAESRRPLGLTVVGGLLFSQALTLFVTPVFYVYMEKIRTAFSHNRVAAESSGAGREEMQN